MFSTITGRFLAGSQRLTPWLTAVHKKKHREVVDIQKNIEERMIKEKLSKVGSYINNLIASSSFIQKGTNDALMYLVPHFADLAKTYHELATAEAVKEQDTLSTKENTWNGYTLTMNAEDAAPQEISHERVSAVELEGKGRALFCKKLVYVAERVVLSCNSSYHIADIQYLMYLQEHPGEVPQIMKDGEGNIFAGTIVMINSEPHVPIAVWNGTGFNVELFPLSFGFEDVAQFVIIERNH